jgi:hypothetical protein
MLSMSNGEASAAGDIGQAVQVNNSPQASTAEFRDQYARTHESETGLNKFWSRTTMGNGWTLERRRRQTELIRRWRPCERSNRAVARRRMDADAAPISVGLSVCCACAHGDRSPRKSRHTCHSQNASVTSHDPLERRRRRSYDCRNDDRCLRDAPEYRAILDYMGVETRQPRVSTFTSRRPWISVTG